MIFFLGERTQGGAAHKTIGKESDGGERLMNFVGDEARELSHNTRALQRFDTIALGTFPLRRFVKFFLASSNQHVGAPGMQKKCGKKSRDHGDVRPVAAKETFKRPGFRTSVGAQRECGQQFIDGLEVGRYAPGASTRLSRQCEKRDEKGLRVFGRHGGHHGNRLGRIEPRGMKTRDLSIHGPLGRQRTKRRDEFGVAYA